MWKWRAGDPRRFEKSTEFRPVPLPYLAWPEADPLKAHGLGASGAEGCDDMRALDEKTGLAMALTACQIEEALKVHDEVLNTLQLHYGGYYPHFILTLKYMLELLSRVGSKEVAGEVLERIARL